MNKYILFDFQTFYTDSKTRYLFSVIRTENRDTEIEFVNWYFLWHVFSEWADKLTESNKGKHFIGDFLPPDELERFMETYKVRTNRDFMSKYHCCKHEDKSLNISTPL